MLGRFLQRFQQRIKSLRREHMDFINDVNLVPGTTGTNGSIGSQLADLVDSAITRTVDLQHINVFT